MTCDFLDLLLATISSFLPWDCVEQEQAYWALEMAELMVFAHVRSLDSSKPSSHLCAEAVGHPLTHPPPLTK